MKLLSRLGLLPSWRTVGSVHLFLDAEMLTFFILTRPGINEHVLTSSSGIGSIGAILTVFCPIPELSCYMTNERAVLKFVLAMHAVGITAVVWAVLFG